MKTLPFLVLCAALAACGDNNAGGAGPSDASTSPDAMCSNCPPPPTLGAQMDRIGRPAINTALDHTFDTNATNTGNAKDAYNVDGTPASWGGYAPEIAANLAILDSLDSTASGTGCGNQLLYNAMAAGGGTAAADSYATLATILADDELVLDTSKGTCDSYLAVELGVATGTANTSCGGRAPTYDVIDVSYSALAAGLAGFNLTTTPPTPLVGDGVDAHLDVHDDTFPFLGDPH